MLEWGFCKAVDIPEWDVPVTECLSSEPAPDFSHQLNAIANSISGPAHRQARFSSPCYLARHERSHTGERPFPCRLCAMAFSRKDNLRVHERRYHSAGRATPGLRRRHHGPPQHTAAPFPDLEGCTTRA
ncbi:zinc finger and BTB domain-containing protein 8A-like isoform X6 [Haemaphysalis longicornis]